VDEGAGPAARQEAPQIPRGAETVLLVEDEKALRELAALRPQLKVLYMSGYSEGIVERQGELEPGMHFLQKPFKSSALLLKVREALGG